MPCSRCGQKRSKAVANLRTASTPTYSYIAPDGTTTSSLTRKQADMLRSKNGGQGRITAER